MHINELDYDILYHVFRTIDGDDKKRLIKISSVCRYWRGFILPYLYSTPTIIYRGDTLKSDAKHICSNGYTKYARALRIYLSDVRVDSKKFITVLEESGIEQAVWPQIAKLDIFSSMQSSMDMDMGMNMDADAKGTVKDIASMVLKCLPHIREIVAHEIEELDSGSRYNPIFLASELASRYSTQLRKLELSIESAHLSEGLSLPQPLTHLFVEMDSQEIHALTEIFAPTLRFLNISGVPPDITWSWFSSCNDEDSEVWFSSLLNLEIVFGEASVLPYHDGDLSDIHQSTSRSDYRHTAKRVHFPVLKRLKLQDYPHVDGGFCKLFVDCPLQEINIEWCDGIGCQIPPQILSRVSYMAFAIRHSWSQPRAGVDEQQQHLAERRAIERNLASLMSTPSSAYSASISLSGACASVRPSTLSLPHTIAWHSIRKLALGFHIDMKSVLTVLADLPRLRVFSFHMRDSYLKAVSSEDGIIDEGTSKYQPVVNKSIDYISISGHGKLISKEALAFLLPRLLPLVPLLIRLKVSYISAKICKEVICDPNSHLEWIVDQLEIV